MKKSLVLAIVLALMIFGVQSNLEVHRQIMKSLEAKPIGEMFKFWHYFMQRTYDFNSTEGKKRFSIFKENVEKIQQINSENQGFTLGLGYFSDYHISEFESPLRSNDDLYNQKPSFDELADEDDRTEGEVENLKDTKPFSTPDWTGKFEGKFPIINPTYWKGKICSNHTLAIVFASLFNVYAKIVDDIPNFKEVSAMFFRHKANLGERVENCAFAAAPERFIFDIDSLPTEEELPWNDVYYLPTKQIKYEYATRLDLCVYPFYNCDDKMLIGHLEEGPYVSRLAYTFEVIHYTEGVIDSSKCAERSADNGVLVNRITDKFVEVILPLPVTASSGLGTNYSKTPFVVRISQDLNGHPRKSCGLRSQAYFVQLLERK